MKGIRKLLVKILGLEKYLFLISSIYIKMISLNLLKKKYPEIHFLKKIIKPDFICLDIGANLGYYTTVLSRTASKGGVFGVEPIPLFIKIWKKNTKKYKNVKLHEIALGSEKKQVSMTIPIVNGIVRHGLSHVDDADETTTDTTSELKFTVQMEMGDQVFSKLDRLDFIKCDIEGYERFAVASMIETIKRFRPIIQIELGGDENRLEVYTKLTEHKFDAFVLIEGMLHPIDRAKLLEYPQDFYFIPSENKGNYSFLAN